MNLLIIDDIHYNVTLLEKVFRGLEHTVRSCTDEKKAIDILRYEDIDAVFCDYNLEDINAIEFRKNCYQKIYIEKGKELPPFVLFSAFSSQDMVSEALKAGFVDCLKKPLAVSDVEKVLDKIAENAESSEEAQALKHALIISSTPNLKQAAEKHIGSKHLTVKWASNVAEAVNYYKYHAEIDYILCEKSVEQTDAVDIFNICKANPRVSDNGLVDAPKFFIVFNETTSLSSEAQESYRDTALKNGITNVIWPPLNSAKLKHLFAIEEENADSLSENSEEEHIQKILIVDDSAFSRAIIANKLKKEGHVVLEASDGNSALEHLKEDIDIDLVLSDLNLPDFNGDEIMKRLQAMKRYDVNNNAVECPPFIIVTSASNNELESNEILDEQFYYIMHKPVDLEILLVLTKRVLDKAKEEETSEEAKQTTAAKRIKSPLLKNLTGLVPRAEKH